MHKQYKAQSLTEILIALAIGVAFINVGILAMSTANILAKVNKANNFALSLLKSQRSILETISENGWHSIADLTIGKHYKLAKQNNSWVIQQGEEKVFDEKPPVAQWNFDEGVGTLAYDNVGTNNGTLMNLPTWQTSPNCVNGSCLGFNGNSNYVDIGNNTSLNITNAITIEAWVNAGTQTTSFNGIVSKTDSNTNGYEIRTTGYTTTQTTLQFRIDGDTGSPGDYTINNGQWYHLIGVYNGAQSLFYVNGVLVNSKNYSTTILQNSRDLFIGKLAYANLYFNGYIDNVNVYDYALTDSQIKQHYNAGLNRLGLVAQWGMDEGSGLKAYDSQGTNDGTLVNSPTWQTSPNCVSGSCLGFDRPSSERISLPSSISDINNFGGASGSVTIESWIKIIDNSGYNGLIQRIGGIDYFSVGSDGVLRCMVHDNANNVNFWPQSKSVIPLNVWAHVVFEFSGGQGYKFYINGALDQSVSNANLVLYNYGSDAYLAYAEGSYLNGSMDDVRIYSRALSADEIANQYKDGYTRYFYVNNVSRDIASDPTASTHNLETTYNANHDDPNTKKVVNETRYLLGTPGRVNTQEQYLARVTNINSLIQTDWSGNSGVNGPEIDFGNSYYSASNLTLSTAGQMSLTSTASNGTLTSTIIDTQSISGSGYFNILWQGDSLCTGCSVKFQIAASNSNAGPWTYYGPTATSDFYIPSGPGIPVPITYAGLYSANAASVQNKRYTRYQITLVPASSVSPVVKDVIINYAP